MQFMWYYIPALRFIIYHIIMKFEKLSYWHIHSYSASLSATILLFIQTRTIFCNKHSVCITEIMKSSRVYYNNNFRCAKIFLSNIVHFNIDLYITYNISYYFKTINNVLLKTFKLTLNCVVFVIFSFLSQDLSQL